MSLHWVSLANSGAVGDRRPLLLAQAVLCAPDDASAAALSALLRSGHLHAHYQPPPQAAGIHGDAASQATGAAPAGSLAVCLAPLAFAEEVAPDEARQRAWNRQLAVLLPWLLPQDDAAATADGTETPPSPRGSSGGSGGVASPPQSPLARHKVQVHPCDSPPATCPAV